MADEPSVYSAPDVTANPTPFPSNWFGANGRLSALLPAVRSALAGVASAAGNNSAQEQLNTEQSQDMQRQLLRSQLAGQALQQKMQQNELANYQSPAAKQASELDTAGKLAQIHNQFADAPPMPVPQSDGSIKYVQPRFNKDSGQWELAPAMMTEDKVISSPDHPQVPYDPTQIVTQPTQVPLTGVNPKVFENQLERSRDREKSDLDLQRQISFATNPQVQQGKIDVSTAEGRARANAEAANTRGSNSALANVPPHLVASAAAAYNKAGEEYATAFQSAQNMNDFLAMARSGNKEAVKIVPLQGALEITTAQGVHRINRTEVDQFAGAGSAYDKLAGAVTGTLTGKNITDAVLNDMDALQKTVSRNAKSLHTNKVASINQSYGSSFQPMDFSNTGGAGGMPPGATHIVFNRADGKNHYTDANNSTDYGVAP